MLYKMELFHSESAAVRQSFFLPPKYYEHQACTS